MRPFCLLLLAGTVLAGGDLDRHPWSGAVKASNRYYVVETNTFPEMADSLAARLEEAYAFYQDRFGPLERKARRPMRVLLFRTRAGYLGQGDGVEGALGHFDAARDRCALIWRGAIGEAGWPVAVHEGCHHYLRRRHPQFAPPSWYGEGIACYFEGLLDPTSERGVSRLRIRAARAALKAGNADLGKLLVSRARIERGHLKLRNFTPTRFYGLAWSLVHFLATDARYRDGFRRFELRLFASQSPAHARETHAKQLLIEECGDLATLEQRWRDHLRALPVPKQLSSAPVYAWELESPRAFVRYAALRRLLQTLPRALRPEVVRCQHDNDVAVRKEACRVLARRMKKDAVPGMIDALDLGDKELKRVALRALAFPGAKEAVGRLTREVEDRPGALRALAKIGDARGYPALRAAVQDRLLPAGLRSRCAAALADDKESRAALNVALAAREPAVRSAARRALGENAPAPRDRDASIARNVRMLNTAGARFSTQRLACRTLAALKAKEAVPLLQRLCAVHEPDRLRLEAVRALVKITGETRGFEPGQGARAREAALRAWANETP